MQVAPRDDLFEQAGRNWDAQMDPIIGSMMSATPFLTKDSKPFSIGSCFAVNINKWFAYQGFPAKFPTWGFHYNTRTILYEMMRCIGEPTPEVTWQVRKGERAAYVDGLRHTINAPTQEALRARRDAISADVSASLNDATFMVMTVGLAEVWCRTTDTDEVILNRAPYVEASDRGGFVNRFMTQHECESDILRIVDIVRSIKGSDFPIVISVSPVPLARTSSPLSALSANIRSKAIITSAVYNLICTGRADFFYFPSFEFFSLNSAPFPLWQKDLRHPTSEAINHVCTSFSKVFAAEEIVVRSGFEVVQV